MSQDLSQSPTAMSPEPLRPKTKRRGFFRQLIHDRPQAAVGLAIVGALALIAIFAPLLTKYDPYVSTRELRQPPSAEHWLGTDDGGFDMVTLLMYGTRTSMIIGLAASFVSMFLGGAAGITAGYFGGKIDGAIMRTADFFLVIPEVPLMVILAAIFGQSLIIIILVIGVLLWAGTARVIRAQVKSVRERVYVKRTRSLGAGNNRIIFRHILPQVGPLLVANTVLVVAVAIFDETFISFLGLGDPSKVSLGKLIENAFQAGSASRGEWWMLVPPGVVVTLLILGCTLFGQALEDALNPRLKVSYLSVRSFTIRRGISEEKGEA
jgi:peptide/nickel transport system permease protein